MLLQIPDMVVQVMWRTNRDKAPTGYAVAVFLLLVNSSVNFIIYTSSSRVYRKRISKVRIEFQLQIYCFSETSSCLLQPILGLDPTNSCMQNHFSGSIVFICLRLLLPSNVDYEQNCSVLYYYSYRSHSSMPGKYKLGLVTAHSINIQVICYTSSFSGLVEVFRIMPKWEMMVKQFVRRMSPSGLMMTRQPIRLRESLSCMRC